MTTVSINQPAYLAWEGYFDRIRKSDIHVVLDHVRSSSDSMLNRNRIAGNKLLTVPIKNRGDHTPICDIEIAEDGKWQNAHWTAIKTAYASATNWKQHGDFFEYYYAMSPPQKLTTVIYSINDYIALELGVYSRHKYSSQLHGLGTKSQLVLDICKHYEATRYLSGVYGREYLDIPSFNTSGIEVVFHEYPAGYSAIDALMHGRALR